MQRQSDIIIVGAGMVGLSCALALVQHGWHVTLVESKGGESKATPFSLPTPADPFDVRVVAITKASKMLFQQWGVWSIIQNCRTCTYQTIKVWDSAADGSIQFSAEELFEPELGHIIEQRVITGALWQLLQKEPGLQLLNGVQVKALQPQENNIQCDLSSGETMTARLVIAADGAKSSIRTLLNIPSKSWSYQQQGIVATVRGTLPHQHTAYQRFSSEGPLALLPLASSHLSSIVWSADAAQAEELMQLSPEAFGLVLTREIEGVMGDLSLVGERACFPLNTHHAKQYSKDRCVLIGDAAHTLHPLAGQGVNLGLLDVAVLVEKLCQARNNGEDIGTASVLINYERKRRTHNQSMIWAMELFKRGFATHSPILQWVRNSGLNWVDKNLWIKRWFVQMAMGTSMLLSEKGPENKISA